MSESIRIEYENGGIDIMPVKDAQEYIQSKLQEGRNIISAIREWECDTCKGSGTIHNKRKCKKVWHLGCRVSCPECNQHPFKTLENILPLQNRPEVKRVTSNLIRAIEKLG